MSITKYVGCSIPTTTIKEVNRKVLASYIEVQKNGKKCSHKGVWVVTQLTDVPCTKIFTPKSKHKHGNF